jgi:hypothetical protein
MYYIFAFSDIKMASSLLAIKKQLECSICCETIDTPKILESCNHVFCKKCISNLVKSKEGSTSFPCPECRVECKLPDGGVDGLRDDFRVASLIGILQGAVECTNPTKTVSYTCSICDKKGADAVCDSCDLDLCPICRKDHLKETKETGSHIVYDLCMKYGRRRKHYCSKCDIVICMPCLKSNHYKKDHVTKPYKLFVTSQLKTLSKQAENISNQSKSTAVRITNVDKQLSELKRVLESKKKRILDKSNAAIKPLTCEIYDIRQEIEKLQIRLERLENTKADHIENMEAQLKAIDKDEVNSLEVEPYKEVISEKINQLESIERQLIRLTKKHWLGVGHHQQFVVCKRSIGDIESTLDDLKQSLDKVECACQRLEVVDHDPTVVTPDAWPSTEYVPKFANKPDAKDEPKFAKVSEVKETPDVGPSMEPLTFAEVAGLNVGIPGPGSLVEDVPKSRLVREWNFDTVGPSCIYSIVSLTKGMAILGGTSDIHPSKIFYFPSMELKVYTEITKGVSPSKDLAANNSGDLVLLRAQEPYLRVYASAWKYQWYKPIPSPEAISCPQAMTCAGNNIVVLNGVNPNVTIFVLNIKGEVLHSLRESCHGRLAYSALNQLVYRTLPGTVDAFKLHVPDGILSPTGTKLTLLDIYTRDICCGPDGDIFAAGKARGGRKKLVVCSVDCTHNQTIVDIVDSNGQCVLVDENVERIRLDIVEKMLIIGCGSKVYQIV